LIDGLADGIVGPSPAMGPQRDDVIDRRGGLEWTHDVTLGLWALLSLVRAVRHSRPGIPDAAVIATNLVCGTPMAVTRVARRRRDPVALAAPVAVAAALFSALRGGWAAVGTTAVLGLLAVADRRRIGARS
jgi:hypothetical protein